LQQAERAVLDIQVLVTGAAAAAARQGHPLGLVLLVARRQMRLLRVVVVVAEQAGQGMSARHPKGVMAGLPTAARRVDLVARHKEPPALRELTAAVVAAARDGPMPEAARRAVLAARAANIH
jgi:hypothetical protein